MLKAASPETSTAAGLAGSNSKQALAGFLAGWGTPKDPATAKGNQSSFQRGRALS